MPFAIAPATQLKETPCAARNAGSPSCSIRHGSAWPTSGTSPDAADTDEDGAGDHVEVLVGRDPSGADEPDPCADLPPGDLYPQGMGFDQDVEALYREHAFTDPQQLSRRLSSLLEETALDGLLPQPPTPN